MHIWFIMDWNRRFAKNLWKNSSYWHKKWFDNLKEIVKLCKGKWVKYATFWCLSVENIKNRSEDEISFLYSLINKFSWFTDDEKTSWVKIKVIWDLTILPEKTRNILSKIQSDTEKNTDMVVTLAIAYSWQDEINRAWVDMSMDSWNWDKIFRDYLDSHFLPDVDLIVRTWWDFRHSWFLLYISAYSQYFFTDKKWPEFSEKELDESIEFLKGSKRTFWK